LEEEEEEEVKVKVHLIMSTGIEVLRKAGRPMKSWGGGGQSQRVEGLPGSWGSGVGVPSTCCVGILISRSEAL